MYSLSLAGRKVNRGVQSGVARLSDLTYYNLGRENLGVGGLVEGVTPTEAANNSAKIAALARAAAPIGPACFLIPHNTGIANNPQDTTVGKKWWFAQNTDIDTGINTGLGTNVQHISVIGEGAHRTKIGYTGTAGPFWRIQTLSSGINWKPQIGGFTVYHDQLVGVSGADILIGGNLNTQEAPPVLYDIDWEPERTLHSAGAWRCVESQSSLVVDRVKFDTRDDASAPSSTACLALTSNFQRGLWVYNKTQFLGTKAATIGIELAHNGAYDMDAMYIASDCLFSGLFYGIRLNSSRSVDVAEITGVQFDETHYAIYAIGPGAFKLLNIHDLTSAADEMHFRFEGAAHNVSIDNVKYVGGGAYYFASFGSSVVRGRVTNCDIQVAPTSFATSAVGIVGANASGTLVATDNSIVMNDGTSRAAIEVLATVPVATVAHNTIVPPTNAAILAPGLRTASRVFKPNTILDANQVAIENGVERFAADLRDLLGSTVPLIWAPKWLDTTTSKSLEKAAARTMTHSSDVSANDRQRYWGDDRCLVHFGGSEWITTPDTADLSFTAGGFSGFLVANATSGATNRMMIAKSDGTTYEYTFWIDTNNKLNLIVYDNTAGAGTVYLSCIDQNALTGSYLGRLSVYGFTWDGVNAAGLKLYVNGAARTVTTATVGAFVQMRDTAAILEIGSNLSHTANRFVGDIGLVALQPGVMTADQLFGSIAYINQFFGLGL